MAAERRDEMVRQEQARELFPLKNRGSGPDQMVTDSAVILDVMESRIEIRDWLECPICLGTIKKTRIVVECMHRFCGDCIEKVLENGMNDCPLCRCHIPSPTSLKVDAHFDGLVGAVCKLIEKCGDTKGKRKATTDDESCGQQTKVRRIIGSPSNQTFSYGSGGETSSDSKFSEPFNPILPNGQINNDKKHVHFFLPPERVDKETRQGLVERMVECMVLPEVRARAGGLPVEIQDSVCCSVYRCIVPYLEVLNLLEERGGGLKMEVEANLERLNQFLHGTVEGLKEKLQKKLEQMESLIGKAMGQEGANKALESLRDAVSNVELELGKLEFGENGGLNLMEKYSPLHATQQVIADLIIMSKNRAKPGGWKKWYSSEGEYERDLKDAVAVYYQIGSSAIKKTAREAILHFCPSLIFSRSSIFNNLFDTSD